MLMEDLKLGVFMWVCVCRYVHVLMEDLKLGVFM